MEARRLYNERLQDEKRLAAQAALDAAFAAEMRARTLDSVKRRLLGPSQGAPHKPWTPLDAFLAKARPRPAVIELDVTEPELPAAQPAVAAAAAPIVICVDDTEPVQTPALPRRLDEPSTSSGGRRLAQSAARSKGTKRRSGPAIEHLLTMWMSKKSVPSSVPVEPIVYVCSDSE